MAVHLDHVFVFTAPGAPEAAALTAAGLRESFRRAHPGQGTANVCYCFDNAYLELLWADDGAGPAAPAAARTGLGVRADWRRSGASPFGIAVRGAGPLPFATWDYAAPFLPDGATIPVALDSDDPRQPFLFRSPGNARPADWTDGRAGPRQRAAGLTGIAGVHLDLPPGLAPAPALTALAAAGLIALGTADAAPRLVLALARADGGPPRRLSLPDLVWA